MSNQNVLVWPAGFQLLSNYLGIGYLSPGELHAGHIKPELAGNGSQAIAKGANGDGDHMVAGREEVRDRGLLPAGAGGRISQDGRGRLEEILQARGDPAQNGRELRTTMI